MQAGGVVGTFLVYTALLRPRAVFRVWVSSHAGVSPSLEEDSVANNLLMGLRKMSVSNESA